MTRKSPQVRDYMTHLPVEAEKCLSVGEAEALMQRHSIHHLPVMNGSKLVGIVSHQDLLQTQLRSGGKAGDETLEAICRADCLTVHATTPVDQVARRMIERGMDSAVVTDGGFVVGVFTTTDALRLLTQVYG